MRGQIIEKIKSLGGSGISFVELERIEGFSGEYAMEFPDTNIVVWPCISLEASEALRELAVDKEIELIPCSSFIYVIDGKIPQMKLAKRFMKYKEPRWIPMAINLKKTSLTN